MGWCFLIRSVFIRVSDLYKTIEDLKKDEMDIIKLSFHDHVEDQNSRFPAFVYLEAFAEDGTSAEYGSFDSIHMEIRDYLKYTKEVNRVHPKFIMLD